MNKNFILVLLSCLALCAWLFRPMTPDRVDTALEVCERLKKDYIAKSHILGTYAIECVDSVKIKKPSQVQSERVKLEVNGFSYDSLESN